MKRIILVIMMTLGSISLQAFSFDDLKDKVEKRIEDFKKFRNPSDMSAKEMVETMSMGVLSTDLITKAFKQALKIGVDQAVDTLGKKDGFMDNAAVRIPLPPPFSQMEDMMRMAGGGDMIDEFILSMNRAAARAAPQTAGIFVASVDDMSFNDAADMLMMDGSPATDYFKRHTRKDLKKLITPIIVKEMKTNKVYKYYDAIKKVANPMMKTFAKMTNFMDMAETFRLKKYIPQNAVNIEEYITEHTIDAIYFMIGQSEKMIRTNPVHQTTSELRKVFGKIMP
ncbi:MAG: Unknown protein [uncultured Sulfurovum sp.]|uniref:DUF4197 domain-containing protein n=1 Tax=uncultured Sulfurovum sp. TaxID=269237 RepID=A0A6S6T122_9BACT|nr:MAG: Unknown protein [uncultured Sulfurovum sp.]